MTGRPHCSASSTMPGYPLYVPVGRQDQHVVASRASATLPRGRTPLLYRLVLPVEYAEIGIRHRRSVMSRGAGRHLPTVSLRGARPAMLETSVCPIGMRPTGGFRRGVPSIAF